MSITFCVTSEPIWNTSMSYVCTQKLWRYTNKLTGPVKGGWNSAIMSYKTFSMTFQVTMNSRIHKPSITFILLIRFFLKDTVSMNWMTSREPTMWCTWLSDISLGEPTPVLCWWGNTSNLESGCKFYPHSTDHSCRNVCQHFVILSIAV